MNINTMKIKAMLTSLKNYLIAKKDHISRTMNESRIERNRYLVLFISSLLLFDYLLFCLHTDKNVFDIIPTLPALEKKSEITVYLPDTDGKSILKETRNVSIPDNTGNMVRLLFDTITKGSRFENTSMTVLFNSYIRNIWIYENSCVIDVGLTAINENDRIIPGSEKLFRKALAKTIMENIPGIEKVHLLEKGVPGKPLWEVKM